ncbi:MAG: radical SAM family heme chaperone HemW [Opitutales bacterium]|nr:radical SAM family heme chaperone HemW [Opitutales bacterium]
MQALSFGLYVHVPFCPNACDYCHFFHDKPSVPKVQAFLKRITEEREQWRSVWEARPFETMYWGGGSPSCLAPETLRTLGALCPVSAHLKEWTVEVSPTSLTPEKLQIFKELGVNRLSLGVQSFQAETLRRLGRKQAVSHVYKAYEAIRAAGFQNVNLDLIFPPDFVSLNAWQNDLETALQLQPEHLSTYCLTYEKATGPFTPQAHQAVDEDREADFYQFTWEFLEHHGYRHYEVSNFARPGFECRHHVNTWRMQEWLGWGPSAASQFQRKRFQNPCDWTSPIGSWVHEETFTEKDLCNDCLIFGLRMREGVDLTALQQRFPTVDLSVYQPLWQRFANAGWIVWENNCVRCTPQGMLLADSLALELL